MARVDAPSRARAQAKPSLLRWALVRAGILYVLSVLFLTCPSRPGHPVCQIGAFTQSNLVSPLHDLALATETGARIDAAYRAHLVPFYQVHAAPAVHGARAFIVDSAVPAAKQAVGPACDAVHRALDPHAARAAAMYAAHAKPAVDAVKRGVCTAARRVVVPVCSAAARQARVVLAEHVGPAARSCVRDYVVPFFANHVQPRWNRQVRPALAHYARVAVRYTRSSVLPALADGAAHGVRSARQLAATHVVPHARRATVAVYVFVKSNVCPPVRRAYALTLKPHVDRVVPWDRVDPVVGRLWAGTWALVDVAQTFIEECYYMAYTIVTGAEHPSVLAKQRARDDAAAAKTSTLDALKLAGDQGQQIHDMARKFSGSARQWIQVARGWVGAAAGSAKDNLAAYGSRATATAKDMWGQAATEAVPAATEAAQSAATMATEAAAEQASEVSEKLKVYVQTVESAVQQAYESRAAQATEEAEPVVSEATAVVESVESAVADTVVESVESLATEEAVGGVESVESLVTETVVGVVESVESAVTDKAAEVVVSVESVVTDKAADFVDSAASIEGAVESAASDLAESAASVGTAVVDSAASIESVVAESAASIESIVADSAVSAKSAVTDAAADIVTEPLSQAAAAVSEAVESPAAITSAIASKLEEKLDAAPSLPVPSLDTFAVAPNVSLVAEDAASAMYKA
ncbi:hypothetical protein H4R23_002739, partial [Coemansia sp. Cherry 401B]